MMILLTGGSACGKSHYAERLCLQLPGPRYYLAAMRPCSEEIRTKNARKQQQRLSRGFSGTLERCNGLAGLAVPQGSTVLLECLCNLTANEMFDEAGRMTDPVPAVLEGVAALRRRCGHLIVVTNEVGTDSRAYDPATCAYVQALGQINAVLAGQADHVYELVCGIPIPRKGTLLF